ncbi:uncharacterized protein LOC142012236 [Carettochelys insculpta]|uniref:uncharacterized protein LOC142012236 n=1 Tax=Carettochelys insculpta TaxID=44489 RepID=UPI003EC113FF
MSNGLGPLDGRKASLESAVDVELLRKLKHRKNEQLSQYHMQVSDAGVHKTLQVYDLILCPEEFTIQEVLLLYQWVQRKSPLPPEQCSPRVARARKWRKASPSLPPQRKIQPLLLALSPCRFTWATRCSCYKKPAAGKDPRGAFCEGPEESAGKASVVPETPPGPSLQGSPSAEERLAPRRARQRTPRLLPAAATDPQLLAIHRRQLEVSEQHLRLQEQALAWRREAWGAFLDTINRLIDSLAPPCRAGCATARHARSCSPTTGCSSRRRAVRRRPTTSPRGPPRRVTPGATRDSPAPLPSGGARSHPAAHQTAGPAELPAGHAHCWAVGARGPGRGPPRCGTDFGDWVGGVGVSPVCPVPPCT